MPRGENATCTCPIRTATSCRLRGRSDDLERVTRAEESLPQHSYSRGGGQAASLKVGSTVILHSAASHSGTWQRFLLYSHPVRSSIDEAYISGVSCRCLTLSSNSLPSARPSGMGRPSWGGRG